MTKTTTLVKVRDHGRQPVNVRVYRGNRALHVIPPAERSFFVPDEAMVDFFLALLSTYAADQQLDIVSKMVQSLEGTVPPIDDDRNSEAQARAS